MIRNRHERYQSWVSKINSTEGGFDSFSKGYTSFGFIALPNNDIRYREWAPGAEEAALIGEFSSYQVSISELTDLI